MNRDDFTGLSNGSPTVISTRLSAETAQINSPRLSHERVMGPVPFLDHQIAVIHVMHFLAQYPTAAPCVVLADSPAHPLGILVRIESRLVVRPEIC